VISSINSYSGLLALLGTRAANAAGFSPAQNNYRTVLNTCEKLTSRTIIHAHDIKILLRFHEC
jgi:hypothetical protein